MSAFLLTVPHLHHRIRMNAVIAMFKHSRHHYFCFVSSRLAILYKEAVHTRDFALPRAHSFVVAFRIFIVVR
jgi:hypothetical protein